MTKQSQTLAFLSHSSLAFPSVEQALAEPNGLLAVGGDLTPERLINAYKNGIFPWFNDDEPIMWWAPNPRAIIPTNDIRINRTLRKALNKTAFTVSFNLAFDQVIEQCADAPFRKEDTWIVADMIAAYKQLHQMGYAHSVEVWLENKLVGGLYGIAINGFFSGESMFYSEPNASKLALTTLAQSLAQNGVDFIDCQLTNPFLETMGCVEVTRQEFTTLKNINIHKTLESGFWQPRML